MVEMNPILDIEGLIRGNSRLMEAELLKWKTRQPIILHKDSWVTWLIIRELHKKNKHYGGVEFHLAGINQRFWIKGVRKIIRKYIKTCLSCRRTVAKGWNQIMAPLPRFRVIEPSRPFLNVGVDYAGPLYIKIGRGKTREKRYICVFSCLQTRAIHLEVAHSLETDAFLRALTRMISRRGRPNLIVSDNGSNFVGILKAIKGVVEKTYKVDCMSENAGISWLFNPPGTPHFNGVSEAMVKLVKISLEKILGKAEVFEEELNTIVVLIEGILNSRPITAVNQDIEDAQALTPNCFIR